MKSKLVFVFFVIATLNGCSSVNFYNNSPLDATSTFSVHNVSFVETSNSYFKIYKLNSKNYAISSKRSTYRDHLEALNNSIVLTEVQRLELLNSLDKIIDLYALDPVDGINIVDYRLTLNEVSKYVSSNTNVILGSAETEIREHEYHKIVLRLQFQNSKKTLFNTGKSLKLYFNRRTYYIGIDDIKEIKEDLSQ